MIKIKEKVVVELTGRSTQDIANQLRKEAFVICLNDAIMLLKKCIDEMAPTNDKRNAAQSIVSYIDTWRSSVTWEKHEEETLDKVYEFYTFLRNLYTPLFDQEKLKRQAREFGKYKIEDGALSLEHTVEWDSCSGLVEYYEDKFVKSKQI